MVFKLGILGLQVVEKVIPELNPFHLLPYNLFFHKPSFLTYQIRIKTNYGIAIRN